MIILCSCSLAQLAGEKSYGKEVSKDGACVISVLQIEELRPGEEVHSHLPKIDKGRKQAVRSHWLGEENREITRLDVVVVTSFASELAIAKLSLHCMSSCGRQMLYK